MTARPMWGYVLVRPIKAPTTTKTGLTLPENQSSAATMRGSVITCGSGSLAMDGSPIEIEPALRNPGTVVVFKKYDAEPVTIDDELLYFVEQRGIIGIIYE